MSPAVEYLDASDTESVTKAVPLQPIKRSTENLPVEEPTGSGAVIGGQGRTIASPDSEQAGSGPGSG